MVFSVALPGSSCDGTEDVGISKILEELGRVSAHSSGRVRRGALVVWGQLEQKEEGIESEKVTREGEAGEVMAADEEQEE